MHPCGLHLAVSSHVGPAGGLHRNWLPVDMSVALLIGLPHVLSLQALLRKQEPHMLTLSCQSFNKHFSSETNMLNFTNSFLSIPVQIFWVCLRFSSDPESVMKRTSELFSFLGSSKDVFFNCYTKYSLTNNICLLIIFVLQKYECFLMGGI